MSPRTQQTRRHLEVDLCRLIEVVSELFGNGALEDLGCRAHVATLGFREQRLENGLKLLLVDHAAEDLCVALLCGLGWAPGATLPSLDEAASTGALA